MWQKIPRVAVSSQQFQCTTKMNNKIQDLVSRIEMASQNLSQDLKTIGQKFLSKIQELPQSGSFNIIAFTVLLLFIVACC
ncbi:small integral membrane protein 5-like [Rhinatrema bivittatum]|uniref:small integral membrane protein 5-like n=1 Tax=Rhinatrema bivittatum TaxID=194408 RepID=UPI001126CDDF|nr:small integral membrane protein 5-like [Rhinatrema bivittatum]